MLLLSRVAMVWFYVRCTRSLRRKAGETYRVGKRKQPPQYFIMQGTEFIVGRTKTRHPAFKDLIEQLALEMNDGEVPTKEAAKERLAAMMAEKA